MSWVAEGGSTATAQPLSRVRSFATPWAAARQASLSFSVSRSVFRLVSIVWGYRKPNKFNKTASEQSPGPLVKKSLEPQ